MLPGVLKTKISEILTEKENKTVRISDVCPIMGGDINQAVSIKTDQKKYFLKWNDAKKYPGMFELESSGLKKLSDTNCIRIPEVISCGKIETYSFLILEYIEAGSPDTNFWIKFGRSLAELHKNSDCCFGLEQDNYIGSLYQSNKRHEQWVSFFIEERISPQLKAAYDANLIDKAYIKASERMFGVLYQMMSNVVPALLHGDLWRGNFMIDENGNPCLFDPAVYYGFREVDLAMSRLFGGFSTEFYDAYNKCYPLEKGWEERVDILNLYPLLVHLNLFGRPYLEMIRPILNKF